jgi:hypothetical protein
MDLQKMISELRAERDRIDEAILAIERISNGTGKRRGRPPKWLAQMEQSPSEPPEESRPLAKGKRT